MWNLVGGKWDEVVLPFVGLAGLDDCSRDLLLKSDFPVPSCELPKSVGGGAPAGVKDLEDEGGGPAGVVEGLSAKLKDGFEDLSLPGVEGGLEL